jgi:uncharacterized protein (TIGR02270 family)
MIVASILQQHADDAAELAANRQALTAAAHSTLARLLRADRRLLANLDGLQLAGEEGAGVYRTMREMPSYGSMFALTVRALESKDTVGLEELFAIAEALPDTIKGMLAAFGWIERTALRSLIGGLLTDGDGFKRFVAVAACGLHRVDPGEWIVRLLRDLDARVRARAFRTAGELGLSDLGSSCVAAADGDDNPDVQFWAAWSAVLLGDRRAAVGRLMTYALEFDERAPRAFRLALQALGAAAAHAVLRDLPRDDEGLRRLIQGSGVAGDPAYGPWLIRHMADVKTARLAGEAFVLITGLDLATAALDRPAPPNFESGPTGDPDDADVDMDPDSGLSWPDVERIEKWWASNAGRFPKGTRYFMGAPVSWEHCLGVLKNGYQRQRILAAHYLCLLNPGTPLFNTSAPAWRQQRQLAKLS